MSSWTPAIPKPWKGVLDKETRTHYFINDFTKVAQWEDPRFFYPADPEEVKKYYPNPPPSFPIGKDAAKTEEDKAADPQPQPIPHEMFLKPDPNLQKPQTDMEKLIKFKGLLPVLKSGYSPRVSGKPKPKSTYSSYDDSDCCDCFD